MINLAVLRCRICDGAGRVLFRLVEPREWYEIDCARCAGLGVVMR